MPADILPGIAVIKVFFHSGTRTESAVAELAAVSQTAVRMTRLTR